LENANIYLNKVS